LAIKCHVHGVYGASVELFEKLQAIPEEERKRSEKQSREANRTWLRWVLGMPVVLAAGTYLDSSILFRVAVSGWSKGLVQGLIGLWTHFGLSACLLILSLLPLAALYTGIALLAAKWGPARRPRFTPPPPGTPEDTQLGRLILRLCNLFPLSRTA